ncbi:unnamed protein product [Microthlaspi erraticum]|uniref:Uncharacterized protein n=1 Tax=Microthlaspi erraticum TaxID=1685480 RepID=A0A6D2HSI5_9BRAS|nr:unnamed protein product [Microthlaspi erraticum]
MPMHVMSAFVCLKELQINFPVQYQISGGAIMDKHEGCIGWLGRSSADTRVMVVWVSGFLRNLIWRYWQNNYGDFWIIQNHYSHRSLKDAIIGMLLLRMAEYSVGSTSG